MGNFLIGAILVIVVAAAVYHVVKKMRNGGGCCGTGEAPVKKIRVEDRDKSHYPYHLVLDVDGMTCSNCARRVENALNKLDGVWAVVDLEKHRADLSMKTALPEDDLRGAVRDAGYTVMKITQ